MMPPPRQPQQIMMPPPLQPQQIMMPPPPQPRPWTKAEDKVFETALVHVPENVPNRWIYVAAQLPGRTAQEAWEHYQALVADVELIELGLVETPASWDEEEAAGGGGAGGASGSGLGRFRGRGGSSDERRRGVPWTEEEHRYAPSNSQLPVGFSFLSFSPGLLRCVLRGPRYFAGSFHVKSLDPHGPPCHVRDLLYQPCDLG
jgi:hypothetical protein